MLEHCIKKAKSQPRCSAGSRSGCFWITAQCEGHIGPSSPFCSCCKLWFQKKAYDYKINKNTLAPGSLNSHREKSSPIKKWLSSKACIQIGLPNWPLSFSAWNSALGLVRILIFCKQVFAYLAQLKGLQWKRVWSSPQQQSQLCSKGGLPTGRVSTTWGLVGNANSPAPPQTCPIRNLRGWRETLGFQGPLGDSGAV